MESKVISRKKVAVYAALFLSVLGTASSAATAEDATGRANIAVVSSRPDMVSGGDALVAVDAPLLGREQIGLYLNGTKVAFPFAAGTRHSEGLVKGLQVGQNLLEVRRGNGNLSLQLAKLTLTNYPITGPILSGPHITPYECRTTDNNLGNPLDSDCSASTQILYYYKSTDGTFKPLADPTAPRPPDLTQTTTNSGQTVPYIVRIESGTINRGVYRIALLDAPTVGVPLPPTFVPGPGWNGKLVLSFGGGGGAAFNQGVQAATTALNDDIVGRGFAFANSTEMINSQHANPYLQGETALMLKEYFIKHIGKPKWTVGFGGSGGSIQQYLISQLFPGTFDGLQPGLSFPETMMPNVWECRLFNHVFASDPNRWTTDKQVAMQGFNPGTCVSWDNSFASLLTVVDYVPGCAVTSPGDIAAIYNATTNPGGTLFCNFLQTNVNLLGRQADGRARRPIDNVGVQYGVEALRHSLITTTEFLDFNQVVGGLNADGYGPTVPSVVVPGAPAPRMVADLDAVTLAYAGGFKNSFTGPGLSSVPIITQRTNSSDVGNIHDTMQDLIVRARIQRANNGRSDNQVIFASSSEATAAGVDMTAISIDVMNQWLDSIMADPTPASMRKVARHKPAMATDACWDKSGQRIAEKASTDPTATCNTIYPRYSTLRLQAGESMVQDGVKCTLKPINYADYAPTVFSDSEKARLQQIFPDGVCDWAVPGVNQVPLAGTYMHLPLN